MDAQKAKARRKEFNVGYSKTRVKVDKKSNHPDFDLPGEDRCKIGPKTPLRTHKLALLAGSQVYHAVIAACKCQKYSKDNGHIRPLPVIEGDDGTERWEVEEI